MITFNSLTKVFKSSKKLCINNSSKIILMSDVHRSDNSWSDNFAHNQNLFVTALNHYYKRGFTYIELGDGDELWENRNFSVIRQTHSHVFDLLKKFYIDHRLFLIYGNHDVVKKNKNYVKKYFNYYYDERKNKKISLFRNIKFHEGLILEYKNKEIFLVHGHQDDLFNDKLWLFTRFLVRYIWRPLELYLGFKDPTSPAKNYKKKRETEKRNIHWSKSNNQMIITGHTHRPMFPKVGEPLYFNTGSCVHPRCITGIEIENGNISLIKWCINTNDKNYLYVSKEIIVGPEKLETYLK